MDKYVDWIVFYLCVSLCGCEYGFNTIDYSYVDMYVRREYYNSKQIENY